MHTCSSACADIAKPLKLMSNVLSLRRAATEGGTAPVSELNDTSNTSREVKLPMAGDRLPLSMQRLAFSCTSIRYGFTVLN